MTNIEARMGRMLDNRCFQTAVRRLYTEWQVDTDIDADSYRAQIGESVPDAVNFAPMLLGFTAPCDGGRAFTMKFVVEGEELNIVAEEIL